jgi:Leucine-rich repeat (LRR) protein
MPSLDEERRRERNNRNRVGRTSLENEAEITEEPLYATVVYGSSPFNSALAPGEHVTSSNPTSTDNPRKIPWTIIRNDKRIILALIVVIIVLLGLTAAVATALAMKTRNTQKISNQTASLSNGVDSNVATNTSSMLTLESFLKSISMDGGLSLQTLSTPQYEAWKYLESRFNNSDNNQNISDYDNYWNSSLDKVMQLYAAHVLRFSIADDQGTMEDMNIDDECSWAYISCNGGKQIVKIDMSSLSFSFSLPQELVFLSSALTELLLPYNNVYGTIPSNIWSNMSRLERLNLDFNALTGTLPSELATLKSLTSLDVNVNQIEGTIPSEFGLMHRLQYLSLASNQITGTIPTELFSTDLRLISMFLNNNSLQGTIPSDVGQSLIEVFYIQENMLTGTIPDEIYDSEVISDISMESNNLTGTISPNIGKLSQLKNLRLCNNQLVGSIPIELTNAIGLWGLCLGNN